MHTIHEIAVRSLMGMPIWVWALLFAVGGLNEYVNRTKKTEVQSLLQGFASFVLAIPVAGTLFARFPLVGWLLTKIATPPQESESQPLKLPPPIPPGVLLLALALGLSACGSAVKVTYATLSAQERIVQAAVEQYPAFDAEKRKVIVDTAPSKHRGQAQLEEWNQISDKIVKAIEGTHAAIMLAKDGVKGVSTGTRDGSTSATWISAAIAMAADLVVLLRSVGFHAGGLF